MKLNKVMTDTKMLQSILDKVSTVDKKVEKGFKDVNKRFDKVDKRIDKLGSLAQLSDDSPTVEEFDKLGTRVTKLEHQVAKN